MRQGDVVYVEFRGRKSVGVKVSGFPRPGVVTVAFCNDSSRHLEVEESKIKLRRG